MAPLPPGPEKGCLQTPRSMQHSVCRKKGWVYLKAHNAGQVGLCVPVVQDGEAQVVVQQHAAILLQNSALRSGLTPLIKLCDPSMGFHHQAELSSGVGGP